MCVYRRGALHRFAILAGLAEIAMSRLLAGVVYILAYFALVAIVEADAKLNRQRNRQEVEL